MPCAVGRHHLHHMERPHRAYFQFALMQQARVAQQVFGFGLQRQQFLRDRQQLGARAAQRHAVPTAVEQFDAALALQRADLAGDGGLADVQRARGRAQRTVVGNGHKGAESGVGHGEWCISIQRLWKLFNLIVELSYGRNMKLLAFPGSAADRCAQPTLGMP
ncbi:hypothetical protein SDC9_130287 [bioreactor metagenome]|uniref:Uncharacterized protein n=1 Tax=bioreactor metagenome TaxID=1076179 RepID=A0A645D1S8_9ZZZZ